MKTLEQTKDRKRDDDSVQTHRGKVSTYSREYVGGVVSCALIILPMVLIFSGPNPRLWTERPYSRSHCCP